jgi:hypothetical protein
MNYNVKDIFLERATANKTFEEYALRTQQNGVVVTDSYGNLVIISTSSFWEASSNNTISSSYALTASYAESASYAENAYSSEISNTASYISITNYSLYSTIYTSSMHWITCSFLTSSQIVDFKTGSVIYAFTSSDHPSDGQYADIILYINNTFEGENSASLSFPSEWINVAGSWPTRINKGKKAIIWLRAYDFNTVIGTYNKQD